MVREVITVEDWAEIRRLHRAEGLPIKEIVRQTGLARNTVRTALRSERPPKYERPSRGSVVDAYEPVIRALLATLPRMPGPVIAQWIDWPHSMGPLKKRMALIRPQYVESVSGSTRSTGSSTVPGRSPSATCVSPRPRFRSGTGSA